MNASKLNTDTLRRFNGFPIITKLYKNRDFVYRIQIKTQDVKPLLDYLWAVPKLDSQTLTQQLQLIFSRGNALNVCVALRSFLVTRGIVSVPRRLPTKSAELATLFKTARHIFDLLSKA